MEKQKEAMTRAKLDELRRVLTAAAKVAANDQEYECAMCHSAMEGVDDLHEATGLCDESAHRPSPMRQCYHSSTRWMQPRIALKRAESTILLWRPEGDEADEAGLARLRAAIEKK